MEQSNVQYLTPEEAISIDPSLIDFLTLNTGTIIKVGNNSTVCEFQEENFSNPQICQHCGRYRLQKGMPQYSNVVLRGGKQNENEEGLKEGQNQAVVEAQPEEGQKEELRALEGNTLLNDILVGGEVYQGDGQYQQNEYQDQGEIPQEGQDYYDNQYGGEQQYVQEEYEDQIQGEYGGEYYEQNPNQYEGEEEANYDNNNEQNLQYPEGYVNNQGVSEQNVESNIPNENYPQEYLPDPNEYEQIPQDPYYPYNPNQPQENNIQSQEPYVKPLQQPIEQEPVQLPIEEPIQPNQPNQPPSQPKIPSHESLQPPSQPQIPSQEPLQPPAQAKMPSLKPLQPPSQPQIPSHKPLQPPAQAKMPSRRPMQPPMKPSVQPKMPYVMQPGRKNVVPLPQKRLPIVPPRPLGPQKKLPIQPPKGKFLPPNQKKKIMPVQPPRTIIPSNQPKVIVPAQPPRVVMPSTQQNKLIPQKPPVAPYGPKTIIAPPKIVAPIKGFRSRPNYPKKGNETLYPDYATEISSKTYKRNVNRNNFRGNRGKKENKYSSKTYQKADYNCDLDNYKYHEINETTYKNIKSLFIVKKGGVTISTNKDSL